MYFLLLCQHKKSKKFHLKTTNDLKNFMSYNLDFNIIENYTVAHQLNLIKKEIYNILQKDGHAIKEENLELVKKTFRDTIVKYDFDERKVIKRDVSYIEEKNLPFKKRKQARLNTKCVIFNSDDSVEEYVNWFNFTVTPKTVNDYGWGFSDAPYIHNPNLVIYYPSDLLAAGSAGCGNN